MPVAVLGVFVAALTRLRCSSLPISKSWKHELSYGANRTIHNPCRPAHTRAAEYTKLTSRTFLLELVYGNLNFSHITTLSPIPHLTMAPSNLPASFNATSKDIEDLLAAQAHLGSKNLQTHMEPYVWKTRADGINVINIGKTWYVNTTHSLAFMNWRMSELSNLSIA